MKYHIGECQALECVQVLIFAQLSAPSLIGIHAGWRRRTQGGREGATERTGVEPGFGSTGLTLPPSDLDFEKFGLVNASTWGGGGTGS